MKKTIITSFISFMLIGSAVAYGADTVPNQIAKTDSPTVIKEETPEIKPKVETLDIRRDKIEVELRATILKIKTVIDRTQVVIDLLNKNGKDVVSASDFLSKSKDSLKVASDSLDQFSDILIPEIKPEQKSTTIKSDIDTPAVGTKVVIAPQTLKDSLKKAEDSMKESKAYLISSIEALKNSLSPKD